MIDIICNIILVPLSLFLLYNILQMIRNEMVFKIRMKWTNEGDYKKWLKYSYDKMLKPNKQNWYGLKLPKEKDFKT